MIQKSSHRTRASLDIPTCKFSHIFYTTANCPNLAPNLNTEASCLMNWITCFL